MTKIALAAAAVDAGILSPPDVLYRAYVQKNFGSAARYFKKALALDEARPVFHVNLGAAWFSQNKVDRAIAEYSRALQLDPDALNQNNRGGVTAQISSPEERARYDYMLAKIYAR